MAKVVFLSIFVPALLVATLAQECPLMYSRENWGGRASRHVPVLPIRPAPLVVIHPTMTVGCAHIDGCAPIIRDIQEFQMEANGWPDISYHFLMAADYLVYQGRGWGRLGENIRAFTNQAINIGFIGPFRIQQPSYNVTNALNELINCGISLGALAQNVKIVAQCQLTPMVSCEASQIYNYVSTLERFEPNPRPVWMKIFIEAVGRFIVGRLEIIN